MGPLGTFLIIILIALVSAIPLWLAQKLLGGKGSLLTVMFVNFLLGLVNAGLKIMVNKPYETWLSIISFVLMLFVYKTLFRLGWIRGLLVWVLQFIVTAILVGILVLLGIGLVLL